MRFARMVHTILPLTAMAMAMSPDASAQTFRTDDPVIRRMWTLGMEESRTEELAQILTDFIGSRLACRLWRPRSLLGARARGDPWKAMS